ncbi:POLQ [Cordylochernes scorpioides]|uniref:POLQ n=1 Tax=Cordylochernes scorpioides TaxID=51811 RepID=A0ABY6KRR2_9ARAC|nr:POLQ [Cordylochernes scorpioides]
MKWVHTGMVTVFCNRLGWTNLEVLLSDFQSRLHHGAATELCSLLRLPSLTARLARLFHSAGLTSPSHLASADPASLARILRNSSPFHSDKQADGETSFQARQKRESRKLFLTGSSRAMTETEVSEILVKEAQDFIQKELGVRIQDWKQKPQQITAPTNPLHASESPNAISSPDPVLELNNQSQLFTRESPRMNPSQLFTSLTASQLKEEFLAQSQSPTQIAKLSSSKVNFDETLVLDSQTDHLLTNGNISKCVQVSESLHVKSHSESLLLCDSFILPTQEFERMIQPQDKGDCEVDQNLEAEPDAPAETDAGINTERVAVVGSEDIFESFTNGQASRSTSPLNLVLSELSEDEQPENTNNLSLSSVSSFKPFYPVGGEGASLKFSTPKRTTQDINPTPRKRPRLEEELSPFSECISPTPPRSSRHTQGKLFTADSCLFSSSSSSSSGDEAEIPPPASSGLTIRDVCSHPKTFKKFVKEWKSQKLFSLAVARSSLPQDEGQGIGGKFKPALAWRGMEVIYLDLQTSTDVAMSDRTAALQEMLTTARTGIAGDWRGHWLALLHCGLVKLSDDTEVRWKDPQLAAYLLNPDLSDFSLHALVRQYLPHMDFQCSEVEMPNMAVLTRMEFAGFGFDSSKARRLGSQISTELTQLTAQASQLAGAPFNPASPLELKKAVGVRPRKPWKVYGTITLYLHYCYTGGSSPVLSRGNVAVAFQKIYMDPEQQLYTPKIENIVTAVIEMYGDISSLIMTTTTTTTEN